MMWKLRAEWGELVELSGRKKQQRICMPLGMIQEGRLFPLVHRPHLCHPGRVLGGEGVCYSRCRVSARPLALLSGD